LKVNIVLSLVGTAEPANRSLAWIEGFAIMVAVIVCSLVTAINNYQKEKQFLKLNEVADSRKKVTLIRNGDTVELHQDELVVGDVITLS
jgi:magnesium-transporting ATPase (P-type)